MDVASRQVSETQNHPYQSFPLLFTEALFIDLFHSIHFDLLQKERLELIQNPQAPNLTQLTVQKTPKSSLYSKKSASQQLCEQV